MASIRENIRKDGSKSFYVLWRDPDEGKQTSMSMPSRARAEEIKALLDANGQRLARVERALESAKASTFTVAKLLDWHLSQPLEANKDTLAKYKRLVNTHLRTQIGAIPASKLEDVDLADWADERVGQGLARKTLLNVTGLLSAAYKRGMAKGKVNVNPMLTFRLPSDERAPRRATFLTKAEFDLIRGHLPKRYHLLADLLVETGMRFSEATALSRADIDLGGDVPIVHVTKAWKGGSGVGWRLGPPKSRESERDVSITKALAGRLRDSLPFRNLSGNPLRNADFHQSGWQKAIDKATEDGLTKDPRPHDLRHTHASWLLAEGVPMFVVSRRLGHANIATTTKLYGHLTGEGHKAALAGLERALGR